MESSVNANTEPVNMEPAKAPVIERNITFLSKWVEEGSGYQNYLINNKYCREIIIPYNDNEYESFIIEYLKINGYPYAVICYKKHSIEQLIENNQSPPYVLYYSSTNEDKLKLLPKPSSSYLPSFYKAPPRPQLPLPTLYSLVDLGYYSIDTSTEIWVLKSLPQSTTPKFYPLIIETPLVETSGPIGQVQQSCIQHTINMLTNKPIQIYQQYSRPTKFFFDKYNDSKSMRNPPSIGKGSAVPNVMATFGTVIAMGGKSKKRKRKKRKSKKSTKSRNY